MNHQRQGQRLVNFILKNYPDFKRVLGTEEEVQSYLDLRARFIETRIFYMSHKEFEEAMKFGD
jgi:hypothetical protein